MGQKVNPHGLRVGVIKDWDSRWFAKDEDFGDTLVSDYKIRKYLKEKLKTAGVPKIEIERTGAGVKVLIHCAKPGIVIGRGGSEIEKLRASLEKMTGKSVSVNVVEIKPGSQCAARRRGDFGAARKESCVPPRDEAGDRQNHAHGREGNQNFRFRTSRRRRDREKRALS